MDATEHEFLLRNLDRLRKRLRLSLLDVAQGTGLNRTTTWLIFAGHQRATDAQLEAVRQFLFGEWRALRDPAIPGDLAAPLAVGAAQ